MATKKAYLRTYNLRILPNVKEEFGLRGNSLRVVSSPVTLYFEARDNSSSFFLEAGEQITFEEGIFAQFDIFHLSATEVNIVLAAGEGANLNSAKIAGQVLVNGVVETTTKGYAYQVSFRDNSALPANTPQVIIGSGANVNGLILHTAQMYSVNTVGGNPITLLGSTLAPANAFNGDVICQLDNLATITTNYISMFKLQAPVRIPPGRGLYFYNTVAETSGFRSCLYSFL